MTEQREKIIDALRILGKSQVKAIAIETGIDRGNCHKQLQTMAESGIIEREVIGDNVYYEAI